MARRRADNTTTDSNSPRRRYVFTIYPEYMLDVSTKNRVKDTDIPILIKDDMMFFNPHKIAMTLLYEIPHARGVLLSIEEGDTKSHVHIQGYVELSKPVRFRAMTETLKRYNAHVETAKADRETNKDYIMHGGKHKDKGTLFGCSMAGAWPESGGREKTIEDEAVRMVLDGYSVRQVISLFGGSLLFAINHLNTLQTLVEKEKYIEVQAERVRQHWSDLEYKTETEDIPF